MPDQGAIVIVRGTARAEADRLIREARDDSAEFPVTLANHLPMQLEIMMRLGASAERLAAHAANYRRINAVPALCTRCQDITRATWRTARGDRSREADLRRFFAQEVERLGGLGAVRRYVPELSQGVAASAMHALMRLAYAILRQDDAEIAVALGYWAATFLTLPDIPGGPPDTDDPLVLALEMHKTAAFRTIRAESDLLWHWMQAVGNVPAFAPLIGRWRVGATALNQIAEAALALYAATGSFEALHALTGAHWLRIVTPHLEKSSNLLRFFWQAILAVYPKIGLPHPATPAMLAQLRAVPSPPRERIAAAVLHSDDEHDHSLVFSAFQEYDRTADPVYLTLAAKRAGLVT